MNGGSRPPAGELMHTGVVDADVVSSAPGRSAWAPPCTARYWAGALWWNALPLARW